MSRNQGIKGIRVHHVRSQLIKKEAAQFLELAWSKLKNAVDGPLGNDDEVYQAADVMCEALSAYFPTGAVPGSAASRAMRYDAGANRETATKPAPTGGLTTPGASAKVQPDGPTGAGCRWPDDPEHTEECPWYDGSWYGRKDDSE